MHTTIILTFSNLGRTRNQHLQSTPPHAAPHHTSIQQPAPQSPLPLAPPILNQPPPASLAAKHSFLQQQYNQLNLSKDDSDDSICFLLLFHFILLTKAHQERTKLL